MATDRLNIILDAFWKGKGAIQSAQRDVGKLNKESVTAATHFKNLAVVGGAAFTGLAIASKLAWDFINRGAELEKTQSRFDNLTKSIGTTSDALLNDMKRASDGMVSNSQLMAGAVELMQGKLAKTHDQVVRLSTVSTQLGWDMGVLAQTINNQSVLRLDNLGIAAEDVIPKFQALKDAGMDVKAAFTQALIEAGEAQLKLVGSEAELSAGKIRQIEAALAEVKDEFDKAVLKSITGALGDIVIEAANAEGALIQMAQNAGAELGNLALQMIAIASGLQKLGNATNTGDWSSIGSAVIESLSGGLPSFGPFGTGSQNPLNTLFPIGGALGTGNQVPTSPSIVNMDEVNTQYRGMFAASQPGASVMADAATRSYKNELEAVGKEYKVVNDLGEKSLVLRRREARAIEEAAAAAENSIGSFGGYAGAVRDAAAEIAALEAATGDYFARARRMQDFNPFESLFESLDRYGGNALQLANVGVAGGLFDQSQAQEYLRRTALMYQADNLAKAIASGQISEQAAVDQLSGLKQGFETGEILAQDFFAGINDETLEPSLSLETDPAWQAYLTVRGQIEANPPTVVLNVVNPANEAERERFNRPPPNVPE